MDTLQGLGAMPRSSVIVVRSIADVPLGWMVAVIASCLLGVVCAQSTPPRFVEVTESAGFSVVDQHWGASWGDLTGDGRPDLAISRHWSSHGPTILENRRGLLFTPMMYPMEHLHREALVCESDSSVPVLLPGTGMGDRHGMTICDLNSDGHNELLVAMGANFGIGLGPNWVFVYEDGILHERAMQSGLDVAPARGRQFTPFHLDRDGLIDQILAARTRPDGTCTTPHLLNQFLGRHQFRYVDVTDSLPEIRSTNLVKPGYLDDLGLVLLQFKISNPNLYSGVWPFPEIGRDLGLPDLWGVTDAVFADFDGDDHFELALGRFCDHPSVEFDSVGHAHAYVPVNGLERGLDVVPLDPEEPFELRTMTYNLSKVSLPIRIGEKGIPVELAPMHLDPKDPVNIGIAKHLAGVEPGVFIGFDPSRKLWKVRVSWPAWYMFRGEISFPSGIERVDAYGWDPTLPHQPGMLFDWDGSRLVDRSSNSGVAEWSGLVSMTGGDLDNDGDVDIIGLQSGQSIGAEVVWWENDGTGHFTRHTALDASVPPLEVRGTSLAVADYDRDGWLDVCMVAGQDEPWIGPARLLRNRGGAAHWLEVELVGMDSGTFPVGTVVTVVCGEDRYTRLFDGGIHRKSQDDATLHFGLGSHTVVDRLEIDWVLGVPQVLTGIYADQRIRVFQQ